MAMACLGVTAAFAVASVLIQWFLVVRHAEHVAELAALAGAGAAIAGEPPCRAAEEAADRNGSPVISCVVRGEGRRVVVEIGVDAVLEPRLPGAPPTLRRTAAAGT